LRNFWEVDESVDIVKVGNVIYTNDFDMDWKIIQRQNKKQKIWIEATCEDRYKSKKDIKLGAFISYSFRYDINYED
jgi:hypothetical protein